MLVHVTRDTVPDDPVLMALQVPDSLIGEVASLPADWSGLPYSPGAQRLGDRWVQEGRCVALLVPSVVLPAERNLLLNPEHPDFRRVKILESEAFVFDRRLLR
jgi:RES domain-containing protein